MNLKAVVLGSAGTYPTAERNTTAIFFKTQYAAFLLDAGEGFQTRLLQCNLDFFLDFIVITHFHTDHYNGLIPYLNTLNAMNRTTPLKIYSPDSSHIIKIMNAMKKDFSYKLSFSIEWIDIVPNIQYLHNNLSLEFFRVPHSIETYGVLVESTNNVSYDKEKLNKWGSPTQIRELFKQSTYEKEGVTYSIEEFISCIKPIFRVIYSADTAINSHIWDKLTEDTLLFHECTHYYTKDLMESTKRGHTHYKQLVSKKISNPTILVHLGAKITEALIKKIKTPPNYWFSKDKLIIHHNAKTNLFQLEWPQ